MRNSLVLSPRRLAPFAMLIILIVTGISAGAFASVFPGSTQASPCDVSNAFANTSDSYLNAHAQDFAAMSHFVEDPNGQTGTFNGSCCTGLMQINTGNLRNPDICGCTRAEYGAMSPQQQIDVYAKYVNVSFANDPSVQTLKNMQANGQTLGGHQVDTETVIACMQMGTGNCAAAIKNGCSSTTLGQGGDNHVNVCTMGDKARLAMQNNPNTFANCSNAVCANNGPGDFPTTTGLASNAPTADQANIVVSPSQV